MGEEAHVHLRLSHRSSGQGCGSLGGSGGHASAPAPTRASRRHLALWRQLWHREVLCRDRETHGAETSRYP
eukprot:1561929-Lingulodinium_polyedra.AAC.1